jgi:predicted negative regulator of RcsB-dependent stress response
MGRVFIVVGFIDLLMLLAVLMRMGWKHLQQRAADRRLEAMLRYNPALALRAGEIDQEVYETLVGQGEWIEAATKVMDSMVNDYAVLIPTEYAQPIQDLLKNNPKEPK